MVLELYKKNGIYVIDKDLWQFAPEGSEQHKALLALSQYAQRVAIKSEDRNKTSLSRSDIYGELMIELVKAIHHYLHCMPIVEFKMHAYAMFKNRLYELRNRVYGTHRKCEFNASSMEEEMIETIMYSVPTKFYDNFIPSMFIDSLKSPLAKKIVMMVLDPDEAYMEAMQAHIDHRNTKYKNGGGVNGVPMKVVATALNVKLKHVKLAYSEIKEALIREEKIMSDIATKNETNYAVGYVSEQDVIIEGKNRPTPYIRWLTSHIDMQLKYRIDAFNLDINFDELDRSQKVSKLKEIDLQQGYVPIQQLKLTGIKADDNHTEEDLPQDKSCPGERNAKKKDKEQKEFMARMRYAMEQGIEFKLPEVEGVDPPEKQPETFEEYVFEMKRIWDYEGIKAQFGHLVPSEEEIEREQAEHYGITVEEYREEMAKGDNAFDQISPYYKNPASSELLKTMHNDNGNSEKKKSEVKEIKPVKQETEMNSEAKKQITENSTSDFYEGLASKLREGESLLITRISANKFKIDLVKTSVAPEIFAEAVKESVTSEDEETGNGKAREYLKQGTDEWREVVCTEEYLELLESLRELGEMEEIYKVSKEKGIDWKRDEANTGIDKMRCVMAWCKKLGIKKYKLDYDSKKSRMQVYKS